MAARRQCTGGGSLRHGGIDAGALERARGGEGMAGSFGSAAGCSNTFYRAKMGAR
jgi:hypothetical protein